MARVLGALLRGVAMGISQLSSTLGLPEHSVRRRLVDLQGSRLVVKRGELRPLLHPPRPAAGAGRPAAAGA